MKLLHLDLIGGASGDMLLGALVDLGAEMAAIQHELRKLPVQGYQIRTRRRHKSGIEGVKVDVILDRATGGSPHAPGHGGSGVPAHDHSEPPTPSAETGRAVPANPHAGEDVPQRNFSQIRGLIEASGLSAWVQTKAVAVFRRIAEAEGRIHGQRPDEVHFHEVGAVDSIVDIVGVCVALEHLGCPKVTASALTEGTGWVRCAHGRFPVPTPATLAIIGGRGFTLGQCEEPGEMITPTGAALIAELAESSGSMPPMTPARIGYGLGTRDHRTRPNVLRAILGLPGDAGASTHDWECDEVVLLETNLDDVSGEVLGHVFDKALRQGALDVFHTPIQMKKQRPGVLVGILCAPEKADDFTELLLTETTALGVRRAVMARRKLRREMAEVATPYGRVQVKLGRLDGRVVQASPEYESCRGIAAQAGVPLREVMEAAATAARELRG